MGNIVLLDDLTINKIAAGEVVERPASVVKEMVENSIDAGATKITVEIKNGGISFIRISDNGKGIAEDDMEMAFERHATSKIRVAEDITKVMSMGFRGEALASVASIANVEMISRTKDSSIGHKIVVEGGKILEQTEVGAPVGTTITVKKLFFNTPVRYKFLKKDYTESGYIEDAITRLALVNKDISFKLINSGKTVIQTTGNGDEKDVIYSIYGKDVAEAIINTEYEYEGIQISGVVGKPEIARSNRSNQLYFVNGRFIKDRTLTAAAEQAFKGMIPINKYGFLVLNLQMDPALVDVNVHPAKLEVRFEEENKVFKAVYYAIKDALSKKELIENVAEDKPEEVETKEEKQPEEVSEEVVDEKEKNLLEFRQGLKELGIAEASTATNTALSDLEKLDNQEESKETEKVEDEVAEEISIPSEEKVQEMTEELIKQRESEEILKEAIKNSKLENPLNKGNVVKEEPTKFNDMYAKIFGNKSVQAVDSTEVDKELSEDEKKMLEEIKSTVRPEKNVAEAEVVEATEIENEDDNDIEKYEKVEDENKENAIEEILITNENTEQLEEFKNMADKNYKFIGIAFSTYIIVEIENEMYIIDQHAAHERIMYEKVKENYYSEEEKDSQMMLLPDIINLSHKETEIIKENQEMFEKAGFSFEAFGENTLKLNGVPNICIDMNTKQLFLELLDEIDNYGKTDRQEKEERFIATIACKSAVKAKMKLTEREVDKLMERLLELPNPFTCPHGRPTAIKMTKYDIERKFARK